MHHLCDKHKFPHLYYILIKKVKKWTSFKPSSSGKGYIGGSRFEWPQVKTIITYQNKKNKKTKKQKNKNGNWMLIFPPMVDCSLKDNYSKLLLRIINP